MSGMSEWGVVLVIIGLIGLITSVSVPVVYVTRTLAKLTAVVEQMQAAQAQNVKSHDKLWEHNDMQDAKLNDHETRIRILEEAD